jgi:hypothetical protein
MDEIDFGTLYQRHADGVFRFALFLTGNRAEAEDVAPETFVRAWMTREEIRVGTLKAYYLLMIARNLCRTWSRTGVQGLSAPRADALLEDGSWHVTREAGKLFAFRGSIVPGSRPLQTSRCPAASPPPTPPSASWSATAPATPPPFKP